MDKSPRKINDSSKICDSNASNSKQLLNTYIYDFLLKSRLMNTAKTFINEADIPFENSLNSPLYSNHSNSPGLDSFPQLNLQMDSPQGFLFEWWQIFWDVYKAKNSSLPSPKDSVSQHYYQLHLAKQRQQEISLNNFQNNILNTNQSGIQLQSQIQNQIQNTPHIQNPQVQNTPQNQVQPHIQQFQQQQLQQQLQIQLQQHLQQQQQQQQQQQILQHQHIQQHPQPNQINGPPIVPATPGGTIPNGPNGTPFQLQPGMDPQQQRYIMQMIMKQQAQGQGQNLPQNLNQPLNQMLPNDPQLQLNLAAGSNMNLQQQMFFNQQQSTNQLNQQQRAQQQMNNLRQQHQAVTQQNLQQNSPSAPNPQGQRSLKSNEGSSHTSPAHRLSQSAPYSQPVNGQQPPPQQQLQQQFNPQTAMMMNQQYNRGNGINKPNQNSPGMFSANGTPKEQPLNSNGKNMNALQDYQNQLMLLEKQNKKRLDIARSGSTLDTNVALGSEIVPPVNLGQMQGQLQTQLQGQSGQSMQPQQQQMIQQQILQQQILQQQQHHDAQQNFQIQQQHQNQVPQAQKIKNMTGINNSPQIPQNISPHTSGNSPVVNTKPSPSVVPSSAGIKKKKDQVQKRSRKASTTGSSAAATTTNGNQTTPGLIKKDYSTPLTPTSEPASDALKRKRKSSLTPDSPKKLSGSKYKTTNLKKERSISENPEAKDETMAPPSSSIYEDTLGKDPMFNVDLISNSGNDNQILFGNTGNDLDFDFNQFLVGNTDNGLGDSMSTFNWGNVDAIENGE